MTSRRVTLFIVFTVAAFLFRSFIALDVKPCIDGDESAVGIMAFHIEDRGEHPLFLYGQRHGGGHSIAAHIAAAMNSLFGRRTYHVQLSAILGFSFFVGLAFLAAEKTLGALPASAVALHLLLCPYLFRPSLRANGYMETLAISLLCFVIVFPFLDRDATPPQGTAPPACKPPGVPAGLLLGILSGIAFWSTEFSAVMTFGLFAACIVVWRKKALPLAAAWIVSFPLGAAASVIDNFKTGFINVRHLMQGSGVEGKSMHGPPIEFFTRELPSFFQFDNMRYYPGHIDATAWLLLGVAVVFAAAALWGVLAKKPVPGRAVVIFGCCFVALYFAVYFISPFRGESARYLLPIEPLLTIICACGAVFLLRRKKTILTVLVAVLLCGVLYADVRGVRSALADDTVSDGYTDITCTDLGNLMDFLQRSGVKHVYSNRFMRWMIIYNTEEKIAAADVNLRPRAVAWSEYEYTLMNSPRPAFLFNNEDNHIGWLYAYMKVHGISAKVTPYGSFHLIEPSNKILSMDFKQWSDKTYRDSGM